MPKQPNQPLIHYSILGFMVFGFVLGVAIGGNESSGFFDFVSKWSSLIGSAVAVFAAWIAFANSMRQIATTIKIKEDEIYRENLAARTSLNIILSDICKYARITIECIENRRGNSSAESPAPALDDRVIQVLEKNVRYATANHVTKLAKLASDLQVQHARFEDREANGDFSQDHHVNEAIYDALELYVEASNLLNYSRFHEVNDHEMSLHSALNVNARYIRDRASIREMIIRRIGEEVRPAADSSATGP